jgi:WD40 repeat protein
VALPDLKQVAVLVPEGGAVGVGMVMRVSRGWREGEVLALYEGGVAVVFDVASGRQVSRLKIGSEPLLCAAVCEDQVTVGAADNLIRVYQVTSEAPQLGEPVRVLTKTKEGTGCAAYRQDNKILITGGWDARVRLYDAKGGEPLAILKEHRKTVTCTATHPTRVSYFATGSDDARIALWDLYP